MELSSILTEGSARRLWIGRWCSNRIVSTMPPYPSGRRKRQGHCSPSWSRKSPGRRPGTCLLHPAGGFPNHCLLPPETHKRTSATLKVTVLESMEGRVELENSRFPMMEIVGRAIALPPSLPKAVSSGDRPINGIDDSLSGLRRSSLRVL